MPRILIIEGDEHVRKMLQMVMERAGHWVATAVNGEEGIELHRHEPADLVIVDMIMPVKDGTETISELRRDFPDIKIIAISGGSIKLGPRRYADRAKRCGASRFLAKPFEGKQILLAVNELLAGDRPRETVVVHHPPEACGG